MCGICGIFNFGAGKIIEKETLQQMCNILKHRGPDSEGYYLSPALGENRQPSIGLGVRRLAIIDLETGEQPIYNENKSVVIVYNGEIYNFLELRTQLELKGHKFYTKTDTETIVHLYEDYGTKCLQYLRGMYAFALWDDKKKQLFLARDRLGKKPLYYTVVNNSFIFASEIKSILKYKNFTPEVDLEAIHLFLTYQYIPSPKTIYKNVYRLPPATYLLINTTGKIQIEKYWHIDFTKKLRITFKDACDEIKRILTEATKLRMISDVPLGVFLSGGHDSSTIVGLMSQLSNKPVKTFSIGFEEEDFSELRYARIVARHFNTDHHEFILKPQFIEILPKIIWHYDQPFADPSALPTYCVANVTRKYVTVALNGDGGDENFAGYLRYKAMKWSEYFSLPFQLVGKNLTMKFASLISPIGSLTASSIFRYIHRLLSALPDNPARRNLLWHCFFDNETKNSIYSDYMRKLFIKNDAYNYLLETFERACANDIIDRILYTDITTYLPECLLVKMDVATMANSLEARSPLLDHKMFEFTAQLPSNWKLHGLTTKYILKQTFKDFLPKKILTRGKQGFGIPVGKWFRCELKDYIKSILLDRATLSRGYFNKEGIKQLINEHITAKRDHGYRLWALLVLELWHRIFVDKNMSF